MKEVAKKCRHCGETIDVAMRSAEEAMRMAQTQSQVFMNAGGGGGGAAASGGAAGKAPFNHKLHLILTAVTCGVWSPVWLLLYLMH